MSLVPPQELLAEAAREAAHHPADPGATPRPLTRDEVRTIIQQELAQATIYTTGALAGRREECRDFFLGRPYGDEQADFSQVMTQELLEAVERVKPALMRIFTAGDTLARYLPNYNGGEPWALRAERAEQATDYMRR